MIIVSLKHKIALTMLQVECALMLKTDFESLKAIDYGPM